MLFRRYIKRYRGKALAVIVAVAIFSASYVTLFATVETFVNSIAKQISEELEGAQLLVTGNFTLRDVEEIASRPEVSNIDVVALEPVLVYKPEGGFRIAVAAFYLPTGIFGSRYGLKSDESVAISNFFARHFSTGDRMNVSIIAGNASINGTFVVSSEFEARRSLIRPRFDLVFSAFFYFSNVSKTVSMLAISAADKPAVKARLESMSNVYSVEDVEAELERASSEARDAMTGVSFFNAFLGLLGAILIAGTFYIVVDERRKHIAVLRAMGASGPSIAKEFLAEGIVLGLIGRLVGAISAVPLSYAGARLVMSIVNAFGYHITISSVRIAPADIYESLAYSIVLVLVGLAPPLIHALRIRPVEAMRPPIVTISGFPTKSLAFALILSGLAIYRYLGLRSLSRDSYYFVLAALTLLVIVLLRAGDKLIGRIGSFFGPAGYVGIRLANLHVKRTVMVATLIAITAGTMYPMISASASRKAYVDDFANSFDFQLVAYFPFDLDEAQARYIGYEALAAGASDVAYVAAMDGELVFGYERHYLYLVSLLDGDVFEYYRLDLVSGHAKLAPGEVAIFDKLADEYGLSVGSTIVIESRNGTIVATVGAIVRFHDYYYRIGRNPDTAFLSEDLARALAMNSAIDGMLVKAPEDRIDDVANAIMDTIGPVIAVRRVSDIVGIAERIYTVVVVFFAVLAAFMFSIALVSMLVTVRQMSYELRGIPGILKAFGSSEASAIGIFVAAAITMILAGLLPALAFAYPASRLMRKSMGSEDLPFAFPIGTISLVTLGLVALAAALAYLAVRWIRKGPIVELVRERRFYRG